MGNNRDCTCGSGAHPRRCSKHPLAYAEHVAELQAEADLYAEAHRRATEAADAEYRRVYAEEVKRIEQKEAANART